MTAIVPSNHVRGGCDSDCVFDNWRRKSFRRNSSRGQGIAWKTVEVFFSRAGKYNSAFTGLRTQLNAFFATELIVK
jgi:hypothetical protein